MIDKLWETGIVRYINNETGVANMLSQQDRIDAAAAMLRKAGYQITIAEDQSEIKVQDPVHGYRLDNTYGVVGHNTVRIYGYLGTSLLAAVVRFIDERS